MAAEHWTLYLDAAGDPGWVPPRGGSAERFYIISGIALTPAMNIQAHRGVEDILETHLGGHHEYELKYAELHKGQAPFDGLTQGERTALADDAFDLIDALGGSIFSTVLDKQAHQQKYGANAYNPRTHALRSTVDRFSIFLRRRDDTGQVVMDAEELTKDSELQAFLYDLKRHGTAIPGLTYTPRVNRKLENILDTIIFTPSEMSPGIQLADFITRTVWLEVHHGGFHRYPLINPHMDRVVQSGVTKFEEPSYLP